ncbi:hypothetical protein KA093_00040 [Candidatus Saccharibacteria bacterium]|nr:hypothetical protein [Candidatus Saccharibacteria bacterium]
MPEETNVPTETGPAPEALSTQAAGTADPTGASGLATVKANLKSRRGTYRPSHKATFIGLAVVAGILAINGVVIWFVVKNNTPNANNGINRTEVTLSADNLEKLGVSRNSVSDQGTVLTVGPTATFNNKVRLESDVTVAGQLILNNALNASSANLAKLQAGESTVNQLNVNNDASISTLNLRKDLNVVGTTKLQGPVNMAQLLTVSNNVNIIGSLAVGGTLSVRSFQASSLVTDTTLTIGGHVITRGAAPEVSQGPAVGPTGNVSISGNDAAGTVAANVGVGGASGIVANVTFKYAYSNTPHVVITTVGSGLGTVYISRSTTGFSIGVNSPMPPGGYAFDYIVMQ